MDERFSRSEINDDDVRVSLNSCMRKLSGIEGIAAMLEAMAVGNTETDGIFIGLGNALHELAYHATNELEVVGIRLSTSAKDGGLNASA